MGIQKIGDITLIQLSSIDSNIYLIGDTAIDSGTGFNFTRLRDALRFMKIEMKDIKQVVNTHGHFDHMGGNGYFLNAKVCIHRDDAQIIEKGDIQLSAADFFDGKLHPRKVDVKLNDGEKINVGNHALKVIHTPGHTHGSICLFDEKRGVLFSGDTVFTDGIGRCDFANSDPQKMEESLKKLAKLKVKNILPGHGKPFNKKTLDTVLKTNVQEFQKRIEDGEVENDYV